MKSKIILMLIAAICCTVSFAQTGLTCNDAIPETANTTCAYTTYITTTTDIWFSFTATSPFAQISLIGADFGDFTSSHIHNISMFEGTCSNLNKIEEDELPFIDIAEELIIDASGLIVGDTYYLRARREGVAACPVCVPTGSPSAEFDLCIQSIEVFQPLDFNLVDFGFQEIPSSSHTFYTNRGQIVDYDGNPRRDIKLYTIGSIPQVFITDNTLSYVFGRLDTIDTVTFNGQRVDMKLIGGNPNARAFKTERAGGYLNYYLSHIPTGISKMKGYNKVVCNDVYPNIDMQYYSNSEGMKIYFIIHPGGNPDDIVMDFTGGNSVDVTSSGGLKVPTPFGNIEFEAGHAYSINPAGKVVPMPWQAEFMYKKYGNITTQQITFDVRKYAKHMPLIIQVDRGHKLGAAGAIDNLEWSSFYDELTDVKTDAIGNVYICGISSSTNFPVDSGAFQDTIVGGGDMIFMKLDSNIVIQYATFMGGTQGPAVSTDERAEAIVLDKKGNIYMTGHTKSNDFPIITGGGIFSDNVNSCPLTRICVWDIVIVKFDSSGIPVWSTFYGDIDSEKAFDIDIDGAGNIYIVGLSETSSTPLLQQSGAFFDTLGNGLILKFDSLGDLKWATKMKAVELHGVAIDGLDNVYITGFTGSSDYPVKKTDPNFPSTQTMSGVFIQLDVSITRFDVSNQLTHSMYYGGDESDLGYGIAIDGLNNVYFTGETRSKDIPVLDSDPSSSADFFKDTLTDPDNLNRSDAYLLKLRIDPVTDSIEILYSTYYGGDDDDVGRDIAIDDSNYVYLLLGDTRSDSLMPFPSPDPSDLFVDKSFNGIRDAQLATFNSSLELVWGFYIGGSAIDNANAITIFKDRALYAVGWSMTGDFSINEFPHVKFDTTIGSNDHFDDNLSSGGTDGFAMRFDLGAVYLIDIPVVGIDENGTNVFTNDIFIYPNPGSDFVILKIKSSEANEITYQIYDITGKEASAKQTERLNNNKEITVDISRLSPGVYFIQVENRNRSLTQKMLKQH